jgi:hypothetical protein
MNLGRLGRVLSTIGPQIGPAFAGFDPAIKEEEDRKKRLADAQIANFQSEAAARIADDARQAGVSDLANQAKTQSTAIAPDIAAGLAKYSSLRGGPLGEGRYQSLGLPDMAEPGTNPSAGGAPAAYGIGALPADLAKMAATRATDAENVSLAGLSPRQALSAQPWNASDLASAQKGRDLYGAMQTEEDKAAAEARRQDEFEKELAVKKIAAQNKDKTTGSYINHEPNDEDKKIASDLALAKIDPESFNKMYSKFKGNDERMRKVYLLAKEINPDFDFATYKADYSSFKNNAQRTQMSNLLRAENLLDTYKSLSDAVSRNDLVGANKATNWLGLGLSNLDKTNLKTMQTVMTEDLSRALTQSGATSDRKMEMAGDIADVMDISNPAAVAKIKILHEIIDANKKAIRGNWGAFGGGTKESANVAPSTGGFKIISVK